VFDQSHICTSENLALAHASIIKSRPSREAVFLEMMESKKTYAISSLSLASLPIPARYSPSNFASVAASRPNAGVTARRIATVT